MPQFLNKIRAVSIQIVGGSPGAGKVLTSDADGNASWQSASSAGVADGSITTTKLADGAVTSAKIADSTITSSDFASSVAQYNTALYTGTSHTLSLSDASYNKLLVFSNNSAVTVTIPADATTNFDVGSVIRVLYIGSGSLTLGGASGVTLLGQMSFGTGSFGGGSFGEYALNQSDSFTVIKTSADTWACLVQQNTQSFAVLA
jgi:hypothetical protein